MALARGRAAAHAHNLKFHSWLNGVLDFLIYPSPPSPLSLGITITTEGYCDMSSRTLTRGCSSDLMNGLEKRTLPSLNNRRRGGR